jgi:hypothetical protein
MSATPRDAAVAVAAQSELRELAEQFHALGEQATVGAGKEALLAPEAMYPFYNRFMTVCMELDRRMGTTELFAAHGDLIKAVRAALKKRVPKATAVDKLSMPLRFAAWTSIMFASCVQIILLMPVLMPVEYALKVTGLRAWSPFNFLAYVMTRCTIAAQGIVVHVEVPAGSRKTAVATRDHKGSIVTYVALPVAVAVVAEALARSHMRVQRSACLPACLSACLPHVTVATSIVFVGARPPRHAAPTGATPFVRVRYNHVANLDPFATFLGSPAAGTNCFLGKQSLFLVPFLGWAMMLVGNIPINRSGREKAQRMVTEASETAIVKRK